MAKAIEVRDEENVGSAEFRRGLWIMVRRWLRDNVVALDQRLDVRTKSGRRVGVVVVAAVPRITMLAS